MWIFKSILKNSRGKGYSIICIQIMTISVVLPSFLMFQHFSGIMFFHSKHFLLIFRETFWLWIPLLILHLRICLFHLYTWRIFLTDREFYQLFIILFLQHFKNLVSPSSPVVPDEKSIVTWFTIPRSAYHFSSGYFQQFSSVLRFQQFDFVVSGQGFL